jgi:hypothetical protein
MDLVGTHQTWNFRDISLKVQHFIELPETHKQRSVKLINF